MNKFLSILLLLFSLSLFNSCQKKDVDPKPDTINLSAYEGNFNAYKVYYLSLNQTYAMPHGALSCKLSVEKNNNLLNFKMRRISDGKDIEPIIINSTSMTKEDLALVFSDGKNRVKITDAEFTFHVADQLTYYYFKR